MTVSLTTKIISELGNSTGSIFPIWAKDFSQDSLTTLVYSKKGGKHDGREKAIEEYGTGAVWVFGIPFMKKIIDKTAYKIAKINPEFDVKKLKEGAEDSLEYSLKQARKYAKEQLPDLEKVAKNKNLTKGLFIGKFIVATGATIAALGGLIHLKQKTTEDKIKHDLKTKNTISDKVQFQANVNKTFDTFTSKNKKTQTFKGIPLSNFMYNPKWNMSILDGAISGTRLAKARHGERGEVLFKEGMVVSFLYFLAEPIQNGLEWLSKKLFKTPINLDYKVIADKDFVESVKNGSLKGAIDNFKNVPKKGVEVLDYVWENQDNVLVDALKKQGAVPVAKSGKINALKFMEADEILGAVDKLEEYVKAGASNIDKFAKKAKGLKIASIFANIAVTAVALGIFVPMLVIKRRDKNGTGNVENPAVQEVEAKIKNQMNS